MRGLIDYLGGGLEARSTVSVDSRNTYCMLLEDYCVLRNVEPFVQQSQS